MTQLPDDTRILTKYRCPDCHLGKIPCEESSKKLFDFTYCSTCDGTGYVQYWASTVELARALNRINSLLSCDR